MEALMVVRLQLSFIAMAAAVSFPFFATARADAVGDAVLSKMDAALNQASTLMFDYDLHNRESGKSEHMLAMKMQVKGSKLLQEFTAPADMNGTKVLILSPTQIYVYLPAFGRVRRVAGHTKDQGFLGLAFSQDDFATTSYGSQYTSQIASQTPTQYVLALTPKAGQDTNYAKIEITVAKNRMLPLQLKYFNAEGANIKTETRSSYSCQGPVCTAGEIDMVNNINGNRTELIRKNWQQNVAIPDEIFTIRNLDQK